VDTYRTEDEQVEALKRWWDENGRSTVAAIVLALVAGFGWQAWKDFDQGQTAAASDLYQSLLQSLSAETADPARAKVVAGQIKTEFGGSTYAQFAALHLARLAVGEGDLVTAEAEIRWALGKADAGSDVALVAQMRLARILAAAGDTDQALTILAQDAGPYAASYAMARGDVLLGLGRESEARAAYTEAKTLASSGIGSPPLATLEQKLQSLNPMPGSPVSVSEMEAVPVVEAAPAEEG